MGSFSDSTPTTPQGASLPAACLRRGAACGGWLTSVNSGHQHCTYRGYSCDNNGIRELSGVHSDCVSARDAAEADVCDLAKALIQHHTRVLWVPDLRG